MISKRSNYLKSQLCKQALLESDIFQSWLTRLGEKNGIMRRKLWEYSFIAQALDERSLLTPDITGLGFGVGQEALTSLFCSLGAIICATDLSIESAKEKGWVASNEHAASLDALNARKLCPDDTFKKNCTFRNVDMNFIPKDLRGFDFVWSSCALEHLGSLRRGERFIYNSMDCLKPGGIAIHTTEYNVSSNLFTIGHGDTVLYRRRDIERIIRNLRAQGHDIEMDFTPGNMPGDMYIDIPPYKYDPHLKMRFRKRFSRYNITSIGLIVQKKK